MKVLVFIIPSFIGISLDPDSVTKEKLLLPSFVAVTFSVVLNVNELPSTSAVNAVSNLDNVITEVFCKSVSGPIVRRTVAVEPVLDLG